MPNLPPDSRPGSTSSDRGEPNAGPRHIRVRIRVRGVVQGVGFRPYLYRVARGLDLGGFVLNDADGVLVEIEGADLSIQRFLERLEPDAPPLARIDSVSTEGIDLRGEREPFRIRESEGGDHPTALVSPDTATCAECLAELFDPSDRRYRYPFINCTNCGPRFTIVRGVPYDRSRTTMAAFTMCDRCRAEYEDPADRRFHAQPNACPDCGPRTRLLESNGEEIAPGGGGRPDDAVSSAGRALLSGAIVAVKGLGGFHLACLADEREPVERLRERKHREDKPFALMVPDRPAARRLVILDDREERLLSGIRRPIVLARRRNTGGIAGAVAPGHRDLGIMLPYAPLHHLLLDAVDRPLVMTSGNVSDEPIAYRDEDALRRLSGIADLFLVHDRPIETRTDDSVVRVVSLGGELQTLMLRRSRGFVPMPLDLPRSASRPTLACGGHLKNTFALAEGSRCWVGHHIGDLENYETYRSFEEGVDRFREIFDVTPEILVHDLHPDYLSTRYARETARGYRSGSDGPAAQTAGVQHHFAHLAACLAEHDETGPAIGLVFDGTGYGDGGTAWGGEILVGSLQGYERAGHLRPARLPGGEAAIREPWRMACAWLVEMRREQGEEDGTGEGLDGSPPPVPDALTGRVDPDAWAVVTDLARRGVSAPLTTSVGRLFDAVSALCGIRTEISYEGQAAIELEMAAHRAPRHAIREGYGLRIVEKAESIVLDPLLALRSVHRDTARGIAPAIVAARFHEGLARGAAAAAEVVATSRGLRRVVLSGGVFQNVRLLERTAVLLREGGLTPLVPRRLPPNDGGLSYGQAAAVAARGRETPARETPGREK